MSRPPEPTPAGAPTPAWRARLDQYWLLIRGDRPVGTIRIDNLDGGSAALRLVGIDPESQGHGHGKALLREAEAFARAIGCGKLGDDVSVLSVACEVNPVAIREFLPRNPDVHRVVIRRRDIIRSENRISASLVDTEEAGAIVAGVSLGIDHNSRTVVVGNDFMKGRDVEGVAPRLTGCRAFIHPLISEICRKRKHRGRKQVVLRVM